MSPIKLGAWLDKYFDQLMLEADMLALNQKDSLVCYGVLLIGYQPAFLSLSNVLSRSADLTLIQLSGNLKNVSVGNTLVL